jgi:hypothetical protein
MSGGATINRRRLTIPANMTEIVNSINTELGCQARWIADFENRQWLHRTSVTARKRNPKDEVRKLASGTAPGARARNFWFSRTGGATPPKLKRTSAAPV